MTVLPHPQPGDALLYDREGWVNRLIRIKTWSDVSHIEVMVSRGQTVAARGVALGIDPRTGVHRYPLTLEGLRYVLRPVESPALGPAMRWFDRVCEGQAYDYVGLLRFFTLGEQSMHVQFCSELATRFYRQAGILPFAKDYDADLVSPGMFRCSPSFTTVWKASA